MAHDFDYSHYLTLTEKDNKVKMLTDYLLEFVEIDITANYSTLSESDFIKLYFENVDKIRDYYHKKYDWTFDQCLEFNTAKGNNSFDGLPIENVMKYVKFLFYDEYYFLEFPEKYSDTLYEKKKVGYKVFENYRKWILANDKPIKIDTAKIKYLRELGLFEKFSEEQTSKIIELFFKNSSNPYKIALLDELGFYTLPQLKNLERKKQNEMTQNVVNINIDSIRKNRDVLMRRATDSEVTRYTARNYIDDIRKELKKIL